MVEANVAERRAANEIGRTVAGPMSEREKPRICVVTGGHLSTCPRMLKAADALHEAGYDVRVVSTDFIEWAAEADRDVRKTRPWKWDVVPLRRESNRPAYYRRGVRHRLFRKLAQAIGPERCPLSIAARAWVKMSPELLSAIRRERCDLIYGGAGAQAAVAVAGRTMGIPFALDLEDFHSGEQGGTAKESLSNRLAERIERLTLTEAAFLTAGSAAIAEAYDRKYGVRPIPINNTFPLPEREPDLTPSDGPGLKLYWFSQTIGPGRGLEDVIRAMGLAGLPGELHLRGNASGDYVETLRRQSAETAPMLQVVVHPPASPERMVELAQNYDIGLATEPGFSMNNGIALSNKAFTYILAGLAVVFTDTAGQRPLAVDLGEGAIVYPPGDAATLATKLKLWANDKASLARAKAAAWEAARRRWHWEHVLERGALLDAVAGIVGGGVRCG
ncbi:MAG: glycosyltransferase [Planctomycetaceae bacterium]